QNLQIVSICVAASLCCLASYSYTHNSPSIGPTGARLRKTKAPAVSSRWRRRPWLPARVGDSANHYWRLSWFVTNRWRVSDSSRPRHYANDGTGNTPPGYEYRLFRTDLEFSSRYHSCQKSDRGKATLATTRTIRAD